MKTTFVKTAGAAALALLLVGASQIVANGQLITTGCSTATATRIE